MKPPEEMARLMQAARARLIEAKDTEEYVVCLAASVWRHLMSCAEAFEAANARADAAEAKVGRLEKLDREAANHVESVICLRTDFTGNPPYVGWKGLGLALKEALDERDRLRAAPASEASS